MEKERKLQIIRAALKRFIRHGLSKTTLDEVARDLRIGKATLYHYFTSKEDLYYQTLRYEISQYQDELKKIFTSEDSWEIKLSSYLLLKENINGRYKLIYDLVIHVVTDEEYRHEKEIFLELISSEEKFLKEVIISYSPRRDDLSDEYAAFLNRQTWNLIFSRSFQQNEEKLNLREILLSVLLKNFQ